MKTKFLGLLAATVCFAFDGAAAEVSDNLYNHLQLICTDINSAKVDAVNKVMNLSAEDAKKFWPIYREYSSDLTKMAMNRAEFVAEFVQTHQEGTFDNSKAEKMAARWFSAEQGRLDLLKKYHRKVQEALSPVQAAQFLQIENQIATLIDLAIAREMPRVGEQKKAEK